MVFSVVIECISCTSSHFEWASSPYMWPKKGTAKSNTMLELQFGMGFFGEVTNFDDALNNLAAIPHPS